MPDAPRWTYRSLTVAASGAFIGFLLTAHPAFVLVALLLGTGAYVALRLHLRRHPVEVGVGVGRDSEDRIHEGSQEGVAPGVSAAGIPISIESRSRWRPRR